MRIDFAGAPNPVTPLYGIILYKPATNVEVRSHYNLQPEVHILGDLREEYLSFSGLIRGRIREIVLGEN